MRQQVGDQPRTRRSTPKRGSLVVPLVVPPGLRVSDRAFRRLCQANREVRLERNAKGELIVMPPAGPDSSQRNLSIGAPLWIWNQQTGLGIPFDSSAGFTLPNTAIRGPDASWMTRERWDALPQQEREKSAHICPDFVAELRSKSNDMSKLRENREEYIAQGIRLGWLIDPKGGTVEIDRPGRAVEVLERAATLSGEDVLPGFLWNLKGILVDGIGRARSVRNATHRTEALLDRRRFEQT